jgi:hypothetical protein
MRKEHSKRIIFSITVEDIQHEARNKLGRTLTEDEIIVAKDGLEWGLLTDIETIYSTIFYEMLTNELD